MTDPIPAAVYMEIAAQRDQAHQVARGALKDMVFAAIPFLMAFATWRAARAARRALTEQLEKAEVVEATVVEEPDGEPGDD